MRNALRTPRMLSAGYDAGADIVEQQVLSHAYEQDNTIRNFMSYMRLFAFDFENSPLTYTETDC
jgi:hypothetical protein